MGTIDFRPYLPTGTIRGREQNEGGFKQLQPSPACTPVACAPSKCTQLYGANTRYIQCSTVREYRPARQVIWVVQGVLAASNECGCVTVQELFEGGVNFLQLKCSPVRLIQEREESYQGNMVIACMMQYWLRQTWSLFVYSTTVKWEAMPVPTTCICRCCVVQNTCIC